MYLERFLCAFMAAVMLSLSGSLIQGTTQNRLAGPSTLGLNGMAVVIVLISHFALNTNSFDISLEHLSSILSLLFFIITAVLVSMTSKKVVLGNRVHSKIGLYIMIGLCFNLFVGAIFSILQFLFLTLNKQFPTELWYGAFKFIPAGAPWYMFIICLLTYLYLFKFGKQLWAISFGNDFAAGLGIDVEKLQRYSLLLSLLLTLVVTSLFGVFSFMGLIFPHLLRFVPLFRKNHFYELAIGAPCAGLLFALLDAACYSFIIKGAEIPVGMVSSIIGTFLLLLLLLKSRSSLFSAR